jgi:hypothetical protein
MTGRDQLDSAPDLTCNDDTAQHAVDGDEATHNRSVAGSRPASPTETRRSQVYAGRDLLTGRKRYVSQQVPGQTKASMREAKQIEAQLLEEVGAGRHKGLRSRTMG